MPSWYQLDGIAKMELVQSEQEGKNVQGFRERIEKAGKNEEQLKSLINELISLPVQDDFPYYEPSDLEEIQKERPKGPRIIAHSFNNGELQDQFLGAWLGRCAGCALGMPLEAEPFKSGQSGHPGWKNVQLWFEGANSWPISNFTPGLSTAREKYGLELTPPGRDAQLENLQYMPSDDDIRYTIIATLLLEQKGADFDTFDVGKFWHHYLTYSQVHSAEAHAYLNFAQYLISPKSNNYDRWKKEKKWVSTHLNPYREWIGAQIRVDGYGYGAAGQPELAAEFGWRDASFSHVKNGIYGAMYLSAMIAAAFVENDVEDIVDIGLSEIPKNSRLSADIHKAVQIARNAKGQLDLVHQIWNAFNHYHPVHTNNNAALVTASLIFAKNDFEKAITTAVLGGWDTDCNGASVGSIMGAKLGASNIPKKWTERFNDTLYADVHGFDPIKISECAQRSFEVYQKIRDS